MIPSVQGRGRGRSLTQLLTNSSHFSPLWASDNTIEVPSSLDPSTIDENQSESGFSSASSSTKSSILLQTSVDSGRGRGRGAHLKRTVVLDDPHWNVTNLTDAQFNSIIRPKKPDKLGILGEQIQLIANYYPVLQFPHKGLVYQYHIQIRNKKDFEIHRERRR